MVSPEITRAAEELFASQKTLEDVVRWGLAETPPKMIMRVVAQDEFTNDVVVPFVEGTYLVYDAT